MKVALVAIAKDEDNYIDEWIRYYFRLGVDDIFIYQNNWRCHLSSETSSERIHLLVQDGECQQISAYNNFIRTHWSEYDFAMFFDVDEFLVVRGGKKLKDFLAEFSDIALVGVNWRLFGDSGIDDVVDGNYSLIERFTRCQVGLNAHVKTIMNLNVCADRFPMANPHYADGLRWRNIMMDVCRRHHLHGPFNTANRGGLGVAYLAHFFCKTFGEFMINKMRKGRADLHADDDGFVRRKAEFVAYNCNDVQDFSLQEIMRTGVVASPLSSLHLTLRDRVSECRMWVRDAISWVGGAMFVRDGNARQETIK